MALSQFFMVQVCAMPGQTVGNRIAKGRGSKSIALVV